MNLSSLKPTTRDALLALTTHGALKRQPGGTYTPPQPGARAEHSCRAVRDLVRAGLAEWTDGEVRVQPTDIGRAMAHAAETAANGGRIERSLAA